MSRTRARLEKLETISAPPSQLIVVHGHSDAEHEAKFQGLQAGGEASASDLFVCIRRFSEPTGASHEGL
jgi:hypothetical protein